MVYFCFIHSFCRSPFYEYYSCQVVAVVSYRTGTMCQIQKPKLFCICLSICCDCLQIDCLRGWRCLHVVVVVVVVDTRCILCTFAVYCCVFLTVMCWTPFSDCMLFGGGESTRTKGGDNRSMVEEWVDCGAAVV